MSERTNQEIIDRLEGLTKWDHTQGWMAKNSWTLCSDACEFDESEDGGYIEADDVQAIIAWMKDA